MYLDLIIPFLIVLVFTSAMCLFLLFSCLAVWYKPIYIHHVMTVLRVIIVGIVFITAIIESCTYVFYTSIGTSPCHTVHTVHWPCHRPSRPYNDHTSDHSPLRTYHSHSLKTKRPNVCLCLEDCTSITDFRWCWRKWRMSLAYGHVVYEGVA